MHVLSPCIVYWHFHHSSYISFPAFSDNPGIAALWQDEKARREWKDLTDDLVPPPSPGVT